MDKIQNKTIVLGISGSIAAYKMLPLIKELKDVDVGVEVICTEHASKLINLADFEKASGNKVRMSLFEEHIIYSEYLKNNRPIGHISLSDSADLILVAPATANIIAKVAGGIADDLLTSTILATAAPVLFCPAMNVKMWKNPATQKNIKALNEYGYYIIPPEYGELACGYKGIGRLANIGNIKDQVITLLSKHTRLKGKKVVVTAGATIEPIDAVRFITNKSSGKMGAALADAASLCGAETVLIKGNNSVSPSRHYQEIPVSTASEMRQAIEAEIKTADIIFHSAAVSDFGLEKPFSGKIKSNQILSLELLPKTKILSALKKINPKTFVVGFKAENNVSQKELIASAFKTLKLSNADLIVANDVGKPGRGFGTETNEVFIVDKNQKVTHIPLQPKQNVAHEVVDFVIKKFKL